MWACRHVSRFNLWFFSVYQKSIIKNDDENRVLRVFANLLVMYSWKWSKWAIYKLICLEIIFLLTYHTQAKDIAVMKSETRNDFRSSCLYDTLKKLSPWDTFSNMAKIRSSWLTFSNMDKIRYYCLGIDDHSEQKSKKTTKGAFLPKIENLVRENFLLVVSWWPHCFQCFLNVCHRGKEVCHYGLWFATMTHKKCYHISFSFSSQGQAICLKLTPELLDF